MPPALLPATAILAGALVGTYLEFPSRPALTALPLLSAAALAAWSRRFHLATAACTCGAFFVAAAILAADARGEALHPSLRSVLGSFFDGFDIDTLGPEPDHDPVPTRVMLREDATARDDYVSLRADVVGVRIESRWRAAEGGISLTVSGAGSAGRARDWRAGRVIEAPVTFRRAARYLNDGVPDFERQLALEGTTLLGSVKSALLVEVVQRGSAFDEWAARMRGHVRRAIRRWIGSEGAAPAIVTAVLIGDRAGLTDEIVDRLQRAGT